MNLRLWIAPALLTAVLPLAANDVIFLHGGEELGRVRVEPPEFALVVGLNAYSVELPEGARREGFDRIRIVPVPMANDGSFNIGHIRVE